MSISLYVVLRAICAHVEILEGVTIAYPTLCSPRRGPRTIEGLWREFLLSISLYVVFRADLVQFGILAGVSNFYLTL